MRTNRTLSTRQRRELDAIAAKHGLTFEALIEKGRFAIMRAARRECYAWLRQQGWSFPEIGGAMNRDHSSIMFSLDPDLKREKMREFARKMAAERAARAYARKLNQGQADQGKTQNARQERS